MTIDEMIQCLQWAKEGRLERLWAHGWQSAGSGDVIASVNFDMFRRRPEPKLRPWRPEEVPDAWIRVKDAKMRHKIIAVTNYELFAGQDFSAKFEWALENCEHSTDDGKTWHPCGVEEIS